MFYLCLILHRTWKTSVIFTSNGFLARPTVSCYKFSNSLKALTVPKRVISVPHTGAYFLQMKTQINKLLSSSFPHLDIRFDTKPVERLSNFFEFKDSNPKGLRSHVVYKITCQRCGALHVGETVRHLHTRTSEHMGITPVFGQKRNDPHFSAILDHNLNTNQPLNAWKRF